MTLRRLGKSVRELFIRDDKIADDEKAGHKKSTINLLERTTDELSRTKHISFRHTDLLGRMIKVVQFSPAEEPADGMNEEVGHFFQPRSEAWLALHPLDMDRPSVRNKIEEFNQDVDYRQVPSGFENSISIISQFAQSFAYRIGWHYTATRVGTNCDLMIDSDWFPTGTGDTIFRNGFLLEDHIKSHVDWTLSKAWVPGRTNKDCPHAMLMITHPVDGDDRLLRGEVLCILETMKFRLSLPEFKDHCIAPVMIISVAHNKGRILQAYWDGQYVVIRQSPLHLLNTKDIATYNLFVRYMANIPIGVTKRIPS
ncbi:uncharacterized protein BO80DRAFT_500489 [Aspergillus ibericus CBS 121593]|uniref:Uncharacterized protein n=1 Tax=Aspergillus ibericus CBS 121593 TaxID=1448316 RepID=A0A395H6D2_9EURO|nr:hypothetical protein BO80DRAFT_500489 [Aspergillus ibericus CBS 121593]RAL03176.1 hypothetical protein BO80DRAFT_500489 [Aspergillus ibericus CBS 121593]